MLLKYSKADEVACVVSGVWDAKARLYEADTGGAEHRDLQQHRLHPPRHTNHQSTQHLCGEESVSTACGGWVGYDSKVGVGID